MEVVFRLFCLRGCERTMVLNLEEAPRACCSSRLRLSDAVGGGGGRLCRGAATGGGCGVGNSWGVRSGSWSCGTSLRVLGASGSGLGWFGGALWAKEQSVPRRHRPCWKKKHGAFLVDEARRGGLRRGGVDVVEGVAGMGVVV